MVRNIYDKKNSGKVPHISGSGKPRRPVTQSTVKPTVTPTDKSTDRPPVSVGQVLARTTGANLTASPIDIVIDTVTQAPAEATASTTPRSNPASPAGTVRLATTGGSVYRQQNQTIRTILERINPGDGKTGDYLPSFEQDCKDAELPPIVLDTLQYIAQHRFASMPVDYSDVITDKKLKRADLIQALSKTPSLHQDFKRQLIAALNLVQKDRLQGVLEIVAKSPLESVKDYIEFYSHSSRLTGFEFPPIVEAFLELIALERGVALDKSKLIDRRLPSNKTDLNMALVCNPELNQNPELRDMLIKAYKAVKA